jgi:hypothetical protein
MTSQILSQIRRLYDNTTPPTVEDDLKQAVRLLKMLPDETSRSNAAVFMDGLSQLRSEWRLEKQKEKRQPNRTRSPKTPKRKS